VLENKVLSNNKVHAGVVSTMLRCGVVMMSSNDGTRSLSCFGLVVLTFANAETVMIEKERKNRNQKTKTSSRDITTNGGK
jgi:hypothetical protein